MGGVGNLRESRGLEFTGQIYREERAAQRETWRPSEGDPEDPVER